VDDADPRFHHERLGQWICQVLGYCLRHVLLRRHGLCKGLNRSTWVRRLVDHLYNAFASKPGLHQPPPPLHRALRQANLNSVYRLTMPSLSKMVRKVIPGLKKRSSSGATSPASDKSSPPATPSKASSPERKPSGPVVVLITGANQGLGFQAARQLAAQSGWHILIGARDAARGQEAVQKIAAERPKSKVEFIQIEVTSDESIAAAVKSVETKFGKLDVLVVRLFLHPSVAWPLTITALIEQCRSYARGQGRSPSTPAYGADIRGQCLWRRNGV
jgi:hypothetical protein